ncbi:MAG: hypothetical protein U0R24_15445 [Solirubrobacterales bacterium]
MPAITVLATIVDWEALLDAAVASVIAGVVVTFAASTAIWGASTFADARRDERFGVAALGGVLAVVGTLGFAAAVAAGLYVMING